MSELSVIGPRTRGSMSDSVAEKIVICSVHCGHCRDKCNKPRSNIYAMVKYLYMWGAYSLFVQIRTARLGDVGDAV